MEKEYFCKIGNVDDIKEYFGEKIKANPDDYSFKVYEQHFIKAFNDKTRFFISVI